MASSSDVAVSWEELKAGIAKAFESDRVDVEQVKQLMSAYVSCRSDWEQYELFDKHKYVWVGRATALHWLVGVIYTVLWSSWQTFCRNKNWREVKAAQF